MAKSDDEIPDFFCRQLCGPQAQTSAEESLLCSGHHRYRLFFNVGSLRPQGSHAFCRRLPPVMAQR